MKKKKSILDNIPVEDRSFKERFKQEVKQEVKEEELILIGECVVCGSPIYGLNKVAKSQEPVVKRSCDCFVTKNFKTKEDGMNPSLK